MHRAEHAIIADRGPVLTAGSDIKQPETLGEISQLIQDIERAIEQTQRSLSELTTLISPVLYQDSLAEGGESIKPSVLPNTLLGESLRNYYVDISNINLCIQNLMRRVSL